MNNRYQFKSNEKWFLFAMGSAHSSCYGEVATEGKDEFKKPKTPEKILKRKDSCLSTYR